MKSRIIKLAVCACVILVGVYIIYSLVNSETVLKIGVDHPYKPWCYFDETTGELTGIDIEIMEEVCRRKGYRAKFISIVWDEKLQKLQDKKVDMLCSCFTITGRMEDYACLGPVFENHLVAVVATSSSIQTLDDLTGKTVVVQKGTTAEEIFMQGGEQEELGRKFGKLVAHKLMEQCQKQLTNGAVDAYVVDIDVARCLIDASYDSFRILEPYLNTEYVGAGFLRTRASLRDKIAYTLDDMQLDGYLDRIAEKYFGDKSRNCWRRIK